MPRFKFLQFDEKTWDDGETDQTWQLGVVKNRSLVTVMFRSPSSIKYSDGGLHVLLSFLTDTSLLGVDFQHDLFCLSFYLFCEYLEPWGDR